MVAKAADAAATVLNTSLALSLRPLSVSFSQSRRHLPPSLSGKGPAGRTWRWIAILAERRTAQVLALCFTAFPWPLVIPSAVPLGLNGAAELSSYHPFLCILTTTYAPCSSSFLLASALSQVSTCSLIDNSRSGSLKLLDARSAKRPREAAEASRPSIHPFHRHPPQAALDVLCLWKAFISSRLSYLAPHRLISSDSHRVRRDILPPPPPK